MGKQLMLVKKTYGRECLTKSQALSFMLLRVIPDYFYIYLKASFRFLTPNAIRAIKINLFQVIISSSRVICALLQCSWCQSMDTVLL